MNWNALKTEIDDPAYVGMTDGQIADAVNSKFISGQGYISCAQLLTWLTGQGLLKPIEDIAANAAHPLYQPAKAVMIMVGGNLQQIFDLADPSIQGLINAFVAASVITAGQRTGLMELGKYTKPWRESVLMQSDPVSAAQIKFAREI